MAADIDLDLYETAYLCGGPRRVAMVALVALCEDGRLEIDPARHRVGVVRRDSDDAVEAAVLAAIPEEGRHLGYAVATVARSEAVDAIGRALRARGLLTRRNATSLRGRSVHRGLTAAEGTGGTLRRVAIDGTKGIDQPGLRNSFSIQDATQAGVPDTRTPTRNPLGPSSDSGTSG